MAYRICSEPDCNHSLEGRPITAKTCSDACRAKRSRRLKRQNREAAKKKAMPQHQAELTKRVENRLPDVAHKVIEDEIRPIVRESITQDTLAAIANMVALTPMAVAAIAEDLQSDDATVRQRAYSLLIKYTVGHGAIVTAPDQDKTQPLQVNFQLPRPDAPVKVPADITVEDGGDTRQCDMCQEDKPLDDFIANSERCTACYEKQQEQATEILAQSNE